MIIYSYTPERGDKISRAIIYSLAGAGLTLALLAEIIASVSSILHVIAFGALLCSILVWSRCMLSFTYSIETEGEGRAPDLVVRENKAKSSRVLSRVSIRGGRLIHSSAFKPNGAQVFDHRPTIFVKDYWIYEVPESDGEGFIRFAPDEKMLELMRSLGCDTEN
jgi:hypothetical protein